MNAAPPESTDTICAVATPPGVGGVGVVRVSGPAASAVARALVGTVPPPRKATLAHFRGADRAVIDHGLALWFPGPASFTGEDVLELQGHGGAVVLDLVVEAALAAGARPARPGDFTERACLNDKLDLAQAEAVADLVESGSRAAARAAIRSLDGEFSLAVDALADRALELRAFVEAALDFPDEEIDFLAEHDIAARVGRLRQRVDTLLAAARQGRLLRDGVTLAIIGAPNAGKSSLLNRLAGYEAAIVTDLPGTTRDVLREHIVLDGLPVHVADTAGIREADDAIEAEGVRRARAALGAADLVLLLVDGTREEVPAGIDCIVVRNKIDLTGEAAGASEGLVRLSARTGAGLDALAGAVRAAVGAGEAGEGAFTARGRHLDALRRADAHLAAAHRNADDGAMPELLAEELRLAHDALGEITGRVLPDDLLGSIFSRFCIGK